MKTLIQIVLILLLTAPGVVWAQSSVTSETESGRKKWRAIIDAQHVPTSREDQEAYTSMTAIGDYFLNKKHRLRIMQSGFKTYSKYESENEFQPSNTRLYHYYNFENKLLGASWMWRNDFSLPVSDIAVRDDEITQLTSTMFISKMFLANRLFASIRPFARYHWNKYRTSPGGRLLPLYTFGSSAILSYSLTSKFSVLGSAFYNIVGRNSSQYDPNFVQREEGIYSFSLALNYQANKVFGFYASYLTGAAQYINEGRYEVYLYDPNNSRFGVGVTAIF